MKKYIIFLLLILLGNFIRAQIVVTAPSFPTVNTYISGWNNVSCYGGNDGAANVAITTGTPPYSISWGPGSPNGWNTTAITDLYAGTWIVTVTDQLGCIGTNWIQITQPDSMQILYVVAGTTVSILVSGGSPSSPGVYHYEWIPEPTSGQFTSSATFDPGTANVLVKVVDGHWCEKVMTINLSTASIADHTDINFNIYPNPVADILHIETGGIELSTIQIISTLGQVVMQTIPSTGTEIAIDMATLSTGAYFIKMIDTHGKCFFRKVLKQ